ncbi:unnamed protein product [Mytilus coruscus]|uniref:Uncharacterized protein n=1 Tax=Mytilus coruscus TaxID=42192 RepID=A0A6J8DY07_MYTCO|nr:unnamed protein product [Mytilus coruscus]
MDKMMKLFSDMDRISNDLTQKSARIDTLESTLSRIDLQLEQKDQEILSLKLQNSKDDTGGEFKEVEYNNKGQLITAMIKDKFRLDEFITFCDNSKMAFKSEAIPRFINEHDGFHLTNNGNAMLASNIRDSIDIALGLPKCSREGNTVQIEAEVILKEVEVAVVAMTFQFI